MTFPNFRVSLTTPAGQVQASPTLPANIRINIAAPFPALVKGSAPVTISKSNGIWTIGLSTALLGQQNPPLPNYPTDFLLVYDSIAKTQFFVSLSQLLTPSQRSITAAGNLPIVTNDQQLNINAVTDLAPVVPLASSRAGIALTFKNLPGSHAQTITATAPDTFDGAAALALAGGGTLTLVPYNDGVNAGWAIV